MIIAKLQIEELKQDSFLIDEVTKILVPSYVDPDEILVKALQNNTTAYLGFSESEVLCSFFFVGDEYPVLKDGELFYLGLSACIESEKGRGLTYQLYKHFLTEVEDLHHQAYFWATTANPLVYLLMKKLFDQVAPSSRRHTELEGLALKVRNEIAPLSFACESPFVLKKFSPKVQYSKDELDRIAVIKSRRNSTPEFSSIDEEQGDRLLIVASKNGKC